MTKFGAWVKSACGEGDVPVFVGLNAPFDWSFINYYFHRFHGENPFGFTALDIKAYYMGVMNCSWRNTRSSVMAEHLHPMQKGNHNAVQDAIYQAELFRLARKARQKGE